MSRPRPSEGGASGAAAAGGAPAGAALDAILRDCQLAVDGVGRNFSKSLLRAKDVQKAHHGCSLGHRALVLVHLLRAEALSGSPKAKACADAANAAQAAVAAFPDCWHCRFACVYTESCIAVEAEPPAAEALALALQTAQTITAKAATLRCTEPILKQELSLFLENVNQPKFWPMLYLLKSRRLVLHASDSAPFAPPSHAPFHHQHRAARARFARRA